MVALFSTSSTAIAAMPKPLRHPQTCHHDCISVEDSTVDGVAAPPESDILARQFEEMLDYDELLTLVEGVSTALTDAALRMEPLAEHVGRACSLQDCGEGNKLQRLASQLDGLSLSLKHAAPHLEAVQQLIQQSKFHSARARCEFTIRERVRAKQLRCDEQVAALTQRDRAGARQSFSRDEKLARLSARDVACEEFACCTERAERLAGVVLHRKPTAVSAILTGLCHFITAFSAGANALKQELNDTGDSTQHHQQQAWRLLVVAGHTEAPQPANSRMPRLPACDFGCGFLADLTPWGSDNSFCRGGRWQHDGTAAGVDTLYGNGKPTTDSSWTEARKQLPLPLGL